MVIINLYDLSNHNLAIFKKKLIVYIIVQVSAKRSSGKDTFYLLLNQSCPSPP